LTFIHRPREFLKNRQTLKLGPFVQLLEVAAGQNAAVFKQSVQIKITKEVSIYEQACLVGKIYARLMTLLKQSKGLIL
jgi:hypothetical protein